MEAPYAPTLPGDSGPFDTWHDGDADPPALVGKRYRIERFVGRGAFGTVFEAIDEKINRPVAVKFLTATRENAPEAHQRFRNEARAASQASHPHIVSVTDFDVLEDGRAYLVMEFVRGVTLADYLRDSGPMDPMRAARFAQTIASALVAAHARGVVHRDLKPANVVVDTEDPSHSSMKILDFGVAKLVTDRGRGSANLTRAGALLGTPAYMAPEQIRSSVGPVDGRADLYSLGIVLYEMLTGKTPFAAGDLGDTLVSQLLDSPRPPSRLRPEIPKSLERVILKALAKNPRDRYASASEMARALEKVLSDERAVQPPRWRRHAGVLAVVAGLGTLMAWGKWREDWAAEAGPNVTRATAEPRDASVEPPHEGTLPIVASFPTLGFDDRGQSATPPASTTAVTPVESSSEGRSVGVGGTTKDGATPAAKRGGRSPSSHRHPSRHAGRRGPVAARPSRRQNAVLPDDPLPMDGWD